MGAKTTKEVLASYFQKNGLSEEDSVNLTETVEQSVNGSRINIDVTRGTLIRDLVVAWKKVTKVQKIDQLTIADARKIIKIAGKE